MEEQVKQVEQKMNLLTSSKYEGLAAAIAAELNDWFLVWSWSCASC